MTDEKLTDEVIFEKLRKVNVVISKDLKSLQAEEEEVRRKLRAIERKKQELADSRSNLYGIMQSLLNKDHGNKTKENLKRIWNREETTQDIPELPQRKIIEEVEECSVFHNGPYSYSDPGLFGEEEA